MANDIEVIFSGQEAIDVTVDLSTISGSLRIFNSDESFDQTITEDTELSDIIVGDSLVSPSNINVAVDTFAKAVSVLGRGYSFVNPSDQNVSYNAGDDKDAEDTVWAPGRVALKAKNSLASFFVLNNNNSFGNTDRFTDVAGGQTYTNGIIVDNYTGISYFYSATIVAWTTYMDNATALSQGGFSDWLGSSKKVIETLINLSTVYSPEVLSYAPFSIAMGTSQGLWSTSTAQNDTTRAWEINRLGQPVATTKASNRRQLYCRKHF
jgi:hypothetical protein